MSRLVPLLRRLAWATSLLLAACGGGSATSAPTPEAPMPLETEVIVRTAENFRNAEQVRAFVAAAARQHVAVFHVLAKQDEDADVPSGATFYPSRLAPAAPGWERFDALAAVLAEAAPRGIRVHAWLPQFHDQVAVRAHPDRAMRTWRDGRAVPYTGSRQTEYFVTPLSAPAPAQAYQRALLDEVLAAYPALSGVMLDWWWSSCLRGTQDKAGATAIVPVMDAGLSDAEVAQIIAHLRSQAPGICRLACFHHETWEEARLARIARWSGH